MPKNKTIGSLALSAYDDIFKPTVSASIAGREQIIQIPLAELHPPEFHPFQVNDDDAMHRLAENIRINGVREPGLARPRTDGGYELLCGNRRKRACEIADIETMPIIIRELDDDDSALTMVDSNLEQREKLLHSEKAWAYRVKMDALNHKGKKGDIRSVDVLVEQTGESRNQIFRIVRLTELICTLLDKVDNRQIAFNPAVELSYLTVKEQTAVSESMERHEVKPSLSQAQRLKKLSQAGELTSEVIDNVLAEIKKPQRGNANDPHQYRKFFPQSYTTDQIDKVITTLLKDWQATQKPA